MNGPIMYQNEKFMKKKNRLIIIIFSYFTGAPGAGGAKSGAGPTIEEVD